MIVTDKDMERIEQAPLKNANFCQSEKLKLSGKWATNGFFDSN
jgi:hypothetical protein